MIIREFEKSVPVDTVCNVSMRFGTSAYGAVNYFGQGRRFSYGELLRTIPNFAQMFNDIEIVIVHADQPTKPIIVFNPTNATQDTSEEKVRSV